jgi:3-oxoacyl-[acyl-carrier-protein] synthase-1
MPSSPTSGFGAHIVATELRCAVGLTAETAGAAIRAGISNVTEHPFLVDSTGEKVFGGLDPAIDPTIVGADRIAYLAALGLRQLSERLVAAALWPADITVVLALPELRPGFDADHSGLVTRSLAAAALPATRTIRVERAGEGHAGGLDALRKAVGLVSSGQRELVVVAAVDSYYEPSTLAWLDAHRRLARARIRSGFRPGEAVALLAVAAEDTCHRLGIDSLGRVRAVVCTQEPRDPAGDTGLLGEALGQAVLGAAADLQLPEELITDAYGDINGELARSHDWGFALLRAATCLRDGSDYVTSAGQCGDVGAATATLGCVLATEAWKFDCANGPRALVWAGSWSGLRGAAILEHGTA